MAADDTQDPADSDLPPDSSCMDTIDPMVTPEAGAEVSPSGAPNAAAVARDIGEAIAAGRWAAPWSALEDVMQSLGRQAAAWRRTVTSVMTIQVLSPATIALVQELQKPPVFPPGLAAPFQEAQSVLRGDDATRSIMRSQVASLAEVVGDLSRSAIATTWPRVSLLESEAARLIHMRDENLRRMTELVRSSSLEREVAAVSNVMRLPREIVESRMSQWLDAKSAVASLQELAAQVMSERPPWPGAYESGPSKLFAGNVGGPESDSPSVALEVEPSPIVMPARPSWRAHPGRRRSYARAVERRDQRERRALAGIVSADQWELLDQIARGQGCSITALVQGVLGILTGVPAPEAQHRIWALGFGTTPVQDTEAPEETSNRVLIRDLGGVLEVSYRGKSGQFRKLKGLHMLKHLIDNPGRRFGVYELWALAGGAGETEERTEGQDMAPGRTSDFGPMEILDRRALKELKDRLDEIREELSEARGDNDQARIKVLTKEREGILGQLPLKMGGKASRKEHSKLEQRARTNVGNLVDYALRVIKRELPKAEAEIRVRLKMGYQCSYGGPPV